MKVLITGGGGFLGYRLAKALLARGTLADAEGKQQAITQITLGDIGFPAETDPRLKCVQGDFSDSALLAEVMGNDTGSVFHFAAVVSGGIDDADLRDFLGFDLGVAITGSEKCGLTLIVTEGFGDIAMARRTFELLAGHQGREACVNGATQIRAGVMRPEIVIPLEGAPAAAAQAGPVDGELAIGAPVRIIRDPHFGVIGKVAGLPERPAVLDSGSKARVLEVSLEKDGTVTVPRANVERIEG